MMELALGTLGRPGIVMIAPVTTTINPAPADSLTSLIGTVNPVGAPEKIEEQWEITLKIIFNFEKNDSCLSKIHGVWKILQPRNSILGFCDITKGEKQTEF